MSFIAKLSSRLFKSKPIVKDQRKSSDHLEKLPLEELMAVIQNSKDDQLKQSAVQKIDQLSNLLTLADIHSGKTSVSHLQKTAKKRIAQLLDTREISATEFCKSVEDPIQRFAILGLMTNQTIADSELANITDETLLTQIVLEATSSRIRQAAAERITQAEHLFHLYKESKNTDKSVYKIIKEKCDRIRSEEKQQKDFLAEQAHLVSSLEQHARHVYDNYYSAKLNYLEQQWKALAQSNAGSIAEQMQARAQSALQACKAKDDLHRAEADAQENLKHALAVADQQIMNLADQLDQLLVSLVQGVATDDETTDQLSFWRAEWNRLTELKEPTKALKENISCQLQTITAEMKARAEFGTLKEHSFRLEMQINNQSEEAETYHRALNNRINSLKPFVAQFADVIALAESACGLFQSKQKSIEDEAQLKVRQFGGLIRKAKDALEAGELSKANSFRNTLEEKRTQMPTLPTHFIHQIEQLDESIAKLKDWKAYAVEPKKLELIAQMEALVSANIHPEVRAEKIKRLQEEWKQLSKGMSDQEQWEKFRELAQQAYAPCHIYFTEQARVRAENLEQCKKLVQQLNDYLQMLNNSLEGDSRKSLADKSYAGFDWRAAEQVIRVARQEWRNYSPTERVATQPVLNEFDALLTHIHQKILHEQARIAALKQSVIDRAVQLIQTDDMRKAIDSVKALQIEWQGLGICGHKQEQQLWQTFRQTCDQVFAKRQQQSAEFKSELDANHATTKELLKQLNGILQLSGKPLLEARNQVDEIRKAFSGMGQLPKAVANELRTEFQNGFHAFDEKIIAERAKEKQQIWINLFEAAQKIGGYEFTLARGSSVAENAKEELRSYLLQLTPLPTGGLKALQQKLDRTSAETNLDENAVRLQALCVAAELLMDIQSPEADTKLRQAIQVEQLQQSFGKKIHNLRAEMESRVFDWVQVGAVDSAMYKPLAERFNLCLLKAIKTTDTAHK